MNDYGANYFINLIASLYFQKLVSFLNFLKLQVSETCSQLIMRLRRKSVRASSIVPRIPPNRLHERESYNQHIIHPDFLKELQTVLSNCFEDIWNVKGASGQGKPRRLQFPRHNLDPPAPSIANEAPALWIYPEPAGEAAPSPLRARARARVRAPRARKKNSKSGCAWWTVCYAVLNFGRRIQLRLHSAKPVPKAAWDIPRLGYR